MPRPIGKRRQLDFRGHIVQGLQLEQAGREEDAQRLYDAILEVDPKNSYALYRRAIYRAKLGDNIEALRLIRDAMRTNVTPDIAADCGVILERLGRVDEAIETYNRALIVSPNNAAVLLKRAIAQTNLRQHAQAVASFDRYLAQQPDDAKTHNLRGLSVGNLGRHRDALESFTRAVALDPNNADAHFHRALELLTLGEFAAGWAEYEWRFGVEGLTASRSPYPQPHWDGVESLTGKTILLYTEQGLGDSIMFARYAWDVAARGANAIIGVLPPVKILLQGMRGIAVIAPGDPVPSFDLQCPLLSLPYFLKTRLDSIPANVPYIAPRRDRVDAWEDRIPRDGSKLVGVVWAGGRDFKGDQARSIALRRFDALFSVPGVKFVSLQRDLRDGDAETLAARSEVLRLGERFGDFADTAAVISMLDLIISVDTSVAHLAGAMARPVWILLPASPDFRWMLERTDSPWYPTARLFRQPKVDDWDSVIANVREALLQLD